MCNINGLRIEYVANLVANQFNNRLKIQLGGKSFLHTVDNGQLRSVLFRLTFREPDRTLETAEVDRLERQVLAALERELGVRRREAGPERPKEG